MVMMIMHVQKMELEVVGIGRRDPMAETMMMLGGEIGLDEIVTLIVMRGMVMGIGITTEDLEGKTIIEVIMMKTVEMEIGFTTKDLGDRR